MLERTLERRFFRERLGARIDHLCADAHLFRPHRNQAPYHLRQHILPFILHDDGDGLRRRDVVADCWFGFDDGHSECLLNFFHIRCARKTTTHNNLHKSPVARGSSPPTF